MHSGRFIFAQLLDLLSRYDFNQCVVRYQGNRRTRSFSCWDQFLVMLFAQLTYRESLRDIESCPRAWPKQLYHLGVRGTVSRSTLADANENRSWRIWADFAMTLIARAQRLYAGEPVAGRLKAAVYVFNTTTIDLCLTLFPGRSSAATRAQSSFTRCWTCAAIFPVLSTFPKDPCTMPTRSTS